MTAASAGRPRAGGHRVLVVDDSAFMRRLVSDVVASTGEFVVAGTARDGEEALRLVHALQPDLLTLDVDMPGVDGLAALRRVMQEAPRPVVMLSAGGADGGTDATLQALEAGAVDFVRKPSGAISLDLAVVAERLLGALRAAAVATVVPLSAERAAALSRRRAGVAPPGADAGVGVPRAPASAIVAVAASTGGPAALAQIIPALPAWPHTAVLIAQHMPAGFTAGLARRLHGASALRVVEAQNGAVAEAGTAYVAPGGMHLRVALAHDTPAAGFRLTLHDDAPCWGVRPAADPLLHAVAAQAGARAVGVVLTGMGCDGAAGLAALRRAGGVGIVQSPSSCVVPGMPDAAIREAGADAVSRVHFHP